MARDPYLDALDPMTGQMANGLDPSSLNTAPDPYAVLPPELQAMDQEQFDPGGFGGFAERFAGGLQGLDLQPTDFGTGILSGFARGLGGRGMQVAQRRQAFEERQKQINRAREQANLAATEKYREDKATEAASKAAQAEQDLKYKRVTPEDIAANPAIGRAYRVGDLAARSDLIREPAKAEKGRLVAIETPEGPRYVREGDALGQKPASPRENPKAAKPPNPTEREHLTIDIGMLDAINRTRDAFKRGFVGPAQGRIGAFTEATGIGRSEGEGKFRSALAAIVNQVLKARSGGAVTPQEAERLLRELPTPNDPTESYEQKLGNFEDAWRTLAQTRREVMAGSGVDISNLPPLPPSRVGNAIKPGGFFDTNRPGGK